jgi:hypothetical protein
MVKNGILTIWDYELNQEIESLKVGSPDWFDWLEAASARSFRYESREGVFTAIKETVVWRKMAKT